MGKEQKRGVFELPDIANTDLVTLLRWCIAVMDKDDSSMKFCASLLIYAIDDNISEKQRRWADRIIIETMDAFEAGVLNCQN